MEKPLYYDQLVESLKNIDTSKISDIVDKELKVNVENQKIYVWVRLFLKEELSDIKENDVISINYLPSNEKLETIFIAYDKQGIHRNEDGIIEYIGEDDKRILCLMIDVNQINTDDSIKTIRSLFKHSRHYDNNILLKRSDLKFHNERTNQNIEYIQFSD